MVHTPRAERFIPQESYFARIIFLFKRNLVQTFLSEKISKEILAIYAAFMLKIILSDKQARALCVPVKLALLLGSCSVFFLALPVIYN